MDVACKKSGAGLSSLLTPYLYDKTNRLDLIFYIGLGFSIVCLIAAIAFVIVETICMDGQPQPIAKSEVTCSSILKFPRIFWLYTFYMAFFYAIINSLYSVSSGLVQTRFGFSVNQAGIVYVSLMLILVHLFGDTSSMQRYFWIRTKLL